MFGKDKLRTLLESKDRNEEKAMWKFLKKKSNILYGSGNFENVSLPQKEQSFALTPLEIFQNSPPLERRKIFFKTLNLGDVFYLKVIKEQPDCYKLLAIDKYRGCMKIDDLSIVMELPKFPQELKYLSSRSFRYIRAALSACNVKERVLYVTLDSSILKDEFKTAQLGPLYSPQKAHYHGEVSLAKSYTDNLYITGQMAKRKQLQDFSNLGINTKTFCSYFSKFHGKIPSSYSPSDLEKIQMQKTCSIGYFKQAVSSFEDKKLHTAMIFLKYALSIWEENYEALLLAIKCCTLNHDIPNAFSYAEKAFKLYQKSSFPKQPLFELLLGIVQIYLTKKNVDFALEALKMAKIVDPSNKNVSDICNTLLSIESEN